MRKPSQKSEAAYVEFIRKDVNVDDVDDDDAVHDSGDKADDLSEEKST